jgi:E3 ubiquitin-protein ligase HUWE1
MPRSKISIKWNKVEKASAAGPSGNREGSPSSSSSGSDSEMDMDMDGIDEDAPDLYRNSALGIIGGEVEDESGDEDDDEEDDMMEMYEDDIDMEDDDEADTEEEREVVIGTDGPDMVWGEDVEELDDEDDEDGGDVPFPEHDGDLPPGMPEGLEEYMADMLEGGEDDEDLQDVLDGIDGPEDFELEDEDEE